jgi:hypothetical protein
MYPVKEILTKTAFLNLFHQVPVGRDDYPYVYLHQFIAADRVKLSFLKYAEAFRLERQRHIPDSVQEDRPLMRAGEKPFPAFYGTGKRAFFMTEELVLKQ